MSVNSKFLSLLQEEMAKFGSGIMLSVKLVNKDELKLLVPEMTKIIDKFSEIVKNVCVKKGDYQIVRHPQSARLCIILPNDTKLAEKLSYLIYSEVQLYIDEELPEIYLKCSIGNVVFNQEQNSQVKIAELIRLLDYGMQSSGNRGYYCYEDNPVNVEEIRASNIQLNLLKSALLSKKARFAYQPIVDSKTGAVPYYECLLRIPDHENKLMSVGPIISAAEATGLINIIDFTVLEMAIKELAEDSKLCLSVNISNSGVLNKNLLKRARVLLKKYEVSERLIIEITETSLNTDFISTKYFIDSLKKLGCRFALDDFGSGFTSFKQLLNLPIDIIKIDGSYVRDILSNEHSRFFVEALIKLAEDLGVKTVAEFVETGEIAQFLSDIKVDGMQGNFFKPASETRMLD